MHQQTRLTNKTALVTGASSGIGKGIALRFAREGADVVVHYNRNRAGADDTAAQIASTGRKAPVIQADVGRKTQVDDMFRQVQEEFGRLDVLVNNAGITPKMPFEQWTEQDWDKTLDTNLKGIFLCSQAALPLLKQSKGVMLNISSIHAHTSMHNFAAYAASKGGIESLTRCMAIEFGVHGIRVNALRPGWIHVEKDAAYDDTILRQAAERIPLQRIGTPEDCGGPAVFLCSDDAAYITGTVLPVDGGHEFIMNTHHPRGHVQGGAAAPT